MNRFELMDRLSKELGSYVHINFVDKNKDFSEEDYQETLKFMHSMEEKAHERLLRTDKKGHCRGNQISGQKFQNNDR